MAIEKITEILVSELGCDKAAVKPAAKVADDLGADSLAVMEVVMELEDAFDIEIPEEEVRKMVTVKDIIDYVESNKK